MGGDGGLVLLQRPRRGMDVLHSQYALEHTITDRCMYVRVTGVLLELS